MSNVRVVTIHPKPWKSQPWAWAVPSLWLGGITFLVFLLVLLTVEDTGGPLGWFFGLVVFPLIWAFIPARSMGLVLGTRWVGQALEPAEDHAIIKRKWINLCIEQETRMFTQKHVQVVKGAAWQLTTPMATVEIPDAWLMHEERRVLEAWAEGKNAPLFPWF